ncbi:DUF4065 domain-containing protein [Rhodoblastus acidophilus]|uniref:DUF4065 domain-containing protein n=1 Tax=Rhodoblastus acidophilus TaxID=1074 RepID=A0A6N8DK64_RHOAC|nr:type II toxin-antitoxin system antitoxin SocA domain-containing protein [Rhodoblastus acidophilus]MCW2273004.1 putative phage-associated protein [Rhodoblastus acidophilus]MTV29905.1 DUF4065 domain-containing protein [Rhodoblastus acidophilus]
MYDARAVSNFFINRSIATARPITAMTLLKILYFAHAWYLVKYGFPLVAQHFEAWQHGPVNRVVYEQIKGLGSKPVSRKLVSFSAKECAFVETKSEFSEEICEFLSNIFDYYSQFHAFKLSDLTHIEGSPWDKIWSLAEQRAVPGMIIPNDTIKKWFEEGGALHEAGGTKT